MGNTLRYSIASWMKRSRMPLLGLGLLVIGLLTLVLFARISAIPRYCQVLWIGLT